MNSWFDAERHVERAHELYESGRWEEALRELKAALHLNPYQGEWHFNLGLTLDALERFEEAIACYRDALKHQGDDLEILNHLALDHLRIGQPKEAIEHLERSQRIDAQDVASYCHRIAAYSQLNDHEQAEVMFYLATQINDEDPRCYFNIAMSLLDRKQFDRAIWCLRQVLRLDPLHGEAYAHLGEAHWAKGSREEAYRCYLQQLRQAPGDVETMIDAGNLLMEMNRPYEAAEKFRRAAETDPAHPEAHFCLGELAVRTNHLESAQLAFEQTLRLDSHYPAAHQKLALIAIKQDRRDEARQHLQQELALDRYFEHEPTAEEFGQLLLEARMPQHAAMLFARLLERNPRDASLCHQMAVSLFMAERYAEGARYCRRALRADPSHAHALGDLVAALLQLGQLRRARIWLSRGLNQRPNDKSLRELRVRLWFAYWRRLWTRRKRSTQTG